MKESKKLSFNYTMKWEEKTYIQIYCEITLKPPHCYMWSGKTFSLTSQKLIRRAAAATDAVKVAIDPLASMIVKLNAVVKAGEAWALFVVEEPSLSL